MKPLTIKSKVHDYKVSFHKGFDFWQSILALPNAVYVVDSNIVKLYPHLFKTIDPKDLLVIDAIEQNKNLNSVTDILRFLSGRKAKRNLNLVSLGGGIVQDITGFAASSMYRGIGWHFIPTTFLAQADSCVGSKTSLNFEGFKNILGGFYPPHQVYICTDFLLSLPIEDIHSGIGEVIKFLLLDDRAPVDLVSIETLAEKLWKQEDFDSAIYASLAVKQSYIAQDEFDNGKRNLFNYGHCFGHALEASSNYKVPHGQAVTVGMIYANMAALNRKLISESFAARLNILMKKNINIALNRGYFGYNDLLSAMKNDKKRMGEGLVLVMPGSDQVEAIKVNDFTESEFSCALDATTEFLSL